MIFDTPYSGVFIYKITADGTIENQSVSYCGSFEYSVPTTLYWERIHDLFDKIIYEDQLWNLKQSCDYYLTLEGKSL